MRQTISCDCTQTLVRALQAWREGESEAVLAERAGPRCFWCGAPGAALDGACDEDIAGAMAALREARN
jgi:hypothetical protein